MLTEDKAYVNMEQSVPTLCALVISERMSTFAHDLAFLYSKITFFDLQNDAICLKNSYFIIELMCYELSLTHDVI